MKKVGCSNDQICDALLDHHNPSNCQISWIFKRYGDKENYYSVGHKSGRPSLLGTCDVWIALRHLTNGNTHDASDLQRLYFPEISINTVKCTLWEEGLGPHVCHTVPFIPKKSLKVWKKWAEECLHWTMQNWRAVNFSDESIYWVFGSDGISWCWRRPGEHLDPCYMKKNVKHGSGKVVVWAMITAKGVGCILRIKRNLNKEL